MSISLLYENRKRSLDLLCYWVLVCGPGCILSGCVRSWQHYFGFLVNGSLLEHIGQAHSLGICVSQVTGTARVTLYRRPSGSPGGDCMIGSTPVRLKDEKRRYMDIWRSRIQEISVDGASIVASSVVLISMVNGSKYSLKIKWIVI